MKDIDIEILGLKI